MRFYNTPAHRLSFNEFEKKLGENKNIQADNLCFLFSDLNSSSISSAKATVYKKRISFINNKLGHLNQLLAQKPCLVQSQLIAETFLSISILKKKHTAMSLVHIKQLLKQGIEQSAHEKKKNKLIIIYRQGLKQFLPQQKTLYYKKSHEEREIWLIESIKKHFSDLYNPLCEFLNLNKKLVENEALTTRFDANIARVKVTSKKASPETLRLVKQLSELLGFSKELPPHVNEEKKSITSENAILGWHPFHSRSLLEWGPNIPSGNGEINNHSLFHRP